MNDKALAAALQWYDEPEEAFREWIFSALYGPGVSSTNRADVIADIVEGIALPSSHQWTTNEAVAERFARGQRGIAVREGTI